MELTQSNTVKTVAILLVVTTVTQPIYTALFMGAPEVSRTFIWGFEGIVFALLAAFAGSALVMAKRYTLGFSAIAFSAVLNVVQVGIGFTQFGPFNKAAEANDELGAIAFSVVSFAFFVYNAAKLLLGLAAVVFGMAHIKEGRKVLGNLTVLVGAVALVTNALVMLIGFNALIPSPIAGGPGVLATLLLAICLMSINKED